MVGKVFFTLQYWLKNPPWDTGVTPPELYAYLESNPPGKALDLGCGTGTNVITMAEYGWDVTGVDYIPRAIRIAERKARRAGLEDKTHFLSGNVLSPGFVSGEYDLVLDIGCFHSFRGQEIRLYGDNISRLLTQGGSFLLYVHLNEHPGSGHGATDAGLKTLEEYLTLKNRVHGLESSRPSAWLQYQKPV